MSYGNWKGVFSFQNWIFNSIFVIKHTLGDPLVLSSQIFLFSPSGHFLSLSLSLSLGYSLEQNLTHADPYDGQLTCWPISLCPSSFPRRSEISELTRSGFVVDPKEKKKGSMKWFFFMFAFVVDPALWWTCLWSNWVEMWKEGNWVLVLWLV